MKKNLGVPIVAWFYLIVAGIFEIVWAIGLKYTQGFTRLYPSLITLVGMAVSVYFLALAAKTLPIGTAYATWTGIGAVGAIVMGIILFNEPYNFSRFVFLSLIIIGIAGLKISS